MASSLALRRAGTVLLSRLRVAPAAVNRHWFNTQVTPRDEDDRRVDVVRQPRSSVSRRRDSLPTFFSDPFDPFFPTRNLSQMLNMMDQLDMMDQFFDTPFASASRGVGVRRGWDEREGEDALYLRVDMPGLDKNQVKVSLEQNTLVIKGEGDKESDDEVYQRRFSSRIDLPSDTYKLDGIKAEMKNGVLKVVVPKVKAEERKNVIEVSVE
ncbi:Molecular chaperone (small heat-shock protein Hsp26/Hsp42) [Handroanthus impetiginosus]|uniref:Molecular chaperone (Small heat-shock protein Hsp26/Hsp42) n=1 Tax=Handroanthus impetiginosus TaxID=429701 RepID=A0A2G9GQK6_9LAMI|nr:Molecular chaperone (small heat-shock protein Hsp26/Hsp42) [Handroanthus impetiginosus]